MVTWEQQQKNERVKTKRATTLPPKPDKMPKSIEKFDFKNGVFKSKCPEELIANLKKISVIQVLDTEGNIIMTFQKEKEA